MITLGSIGHRLPSLLCYCSLCSCLASSLIQIISQPKLSTPQLSPTACLFARAMAHYSNLCLSSSWMGSSRCASFTQKHQSFSHCGWLRVQVQRRQGQAFQTFSWLACRQQLTSWNLSYLQRNLQNHHQSLHQVFQRRLHPLRQLTAFFCPCQVWIVGRSIQSCSRPRDSD